MVGRGHSTEASGELGVLNQKVRDTPVTLKATTEPDMQGETVEHLPSGEFHLG